MTKMPCGPLARLTVKLDGSAGPRVASCDPRLLPPADGAPLEGPVVEAGAAVVAAVEAEAALDAVFADELHAAPAIMMASASRPARAECVVVMISSPPQR